MQGERRSQSPRERTEEEREQARQERERRRLAKGRKGPPPVEPEPPIEVEPAPPSRAEDAIDTVPAPLSRAEGMIDTEPPRDAARRARLPQMSHRPHLPHRAHLPHPHLHRPRLAHRPHMPPARSGAARAGALLTLVLVLAVLVVGGILLAHGLKRSKATAATLAPGLTTIVIPEGETAAQIARIASTDGLSGDYLETAVPSRWAAKLRPSSYGARGTYSLEGFLFPATYEMYVGAPVSRLVSEQLTAFRENFGGAEIRRARALGVTPYQLLIVASMVEREAAIARDRPLVAAVIYNRLRLHMPLGVDATIRYALHDFTRPLTEAQLRSSSPYNTRTHRGLPPTPISNPGMASIDAAARPAKVPYLYYVAGADGCGELRFSTSNAQFERDAAAYRAALLGNGGNVPSCHKKR